MRRKNFAFVNGESQESAGSVGNLARCRPLPFYKGREGEGKCRRPGMIIFKKNIASDNM